MVRTRLSLLCKEGLDTRLIIIIILITDISMSASAINAVMYALIGLQFSMHSSSVCRHIHTTIYTDTCMSNTCKHNMYYSILFVLSTTFLSSSDVLPQAGPSGTEAQPQRLYTLLELPSSISSISIVSQRISTTDHK